MEQTDEVPNTMTEMARVAAVRHDGEAARYLVDGEWQSLTYQQLWERVEPLARGLVASGVEVGDRVALISDTRVEFLIAQLAIGTAGAVAVPVYPSNSPDECRWVVGNSESVLIFCEDADQVAKIEEVRSDLPDLRELVVLTGSAAGTITTDELAARGAGVDDDELPRREAQVQPSDACLIIYTSGTTGRPKGVVLTHSGFAAGRAAIDEMELFGHGDVLYLYLPLAHAFAQITAAASLEVGAAIAFWGRDPLQITAELAQVAPTVLPSVPRIFEKVYAAAQGFIPDEKREEVAAAIELGVKVREAQLRGEAVSDAEQAAFDTADSELFPLVRGIFGGNVKLAISGAAPIAAEILRFFFACGVPVMEGWGMTETTSLGTLNTPQRHRFGSIGPAMAGADIRIADDGEIEMGGPMLMREYWRNPEATTEVMTDDGFLRTGDLGSMDEDGFVFITGRKKDIIITAGGKNLTPANIEGDLRQSRWISQVVMFGDRKPYPVALVTLDAESIVPWAEGEGLSTDVAELAEHPRVREMIQAEFDTANANYARVEQIKRFRILPRDFTLDEGELTPSMKLKRNVVYERYAELLEDLYS